MRYVTTDVASNVKELYEEEFFKLALRDKNPVKRFIGFINDGILIKNTDSGFDELIKTNYVTCFV